jgi:broad specificity phosphatase PhoE
MMGRADSATGITMEQKWPQDIWLVRHGESAGNVARAAAEAASGLRIELAERDVDVPLSDLGVRQAQALAGWFGAMPDAARPNVVLHSPYLRAAQTARIVVDGIGDLELIALQADERLREKEFGVLDRLTARGVRQRYPELYRQRLHVGKFYFRPPGGESWCDVILRLRSVLDTIVREYSGERVLIVGHQVTVNCLRYLFERLDEARVLAFDRAGDVPNCSITSYAFDRALGRRGKLALRLVNHVPPPQAAGAPITAEQDVRAAPKA